MPESIALYLAAAGMSEAAAAAVANALVSTAAALVINAAATALTKKPGQRSFAQLGSDRTVTVRAPIMAHQHVYGRVRVGGNIVAAASSGSRNELMHMVIVLAAHEVEAIDEIWFNDYVLTLNEAGEETSRYTKASVPTSVTETFTVGSGLTVTLAHTPTSVTSVQVTTTDPVVGIDYVGALSSTTLTLPETVPGTDSTSMVGQTVQVVYEWLPPTASYVVVKKHLGSPSQTADADIMAAFPADWTSNHRLRGRAYIYVRLEYSQDLFPYGLPNISAVVRGKRVYDPRTATTAYSANAALCIADYLNTALGAAYGTEIDNTQLAAAANICDESVLLADATSEARYECHGTVDLSQRPREIVSKMLTSCGGRATFVGGKWRIIPAAYSVPAVTITESDLRGPLRVQSVLSRRDLCNAVKGVFISEQNAWQPADFPPVVNALYLSEDGERIWRDVELGFTTSAACAQRLAKIELERTRQQITVTTTVSLIGLQLTPGDTVAITNARMGWTAKAFEVTAWRFVSQSDGGLNIELSLRETASEVFDWNNGEETTVDPAPDTDLPNPWFVAPPTGVELYEFSAPAGGQNVLGVALQWTASAEATVVQYEVQGRVSASPDWQSFLVSGSTLSFQYTPAVAGTTYQARVRAISAAGVRSAWAAATELTVSGIPAPTGLTLTQTTQVDAAGIAVASLLATWTAPSAVDVVAYEVSGKLSTDTLWYGQATVTETRFAYQPIVAGLTYNVRVRAVNRDGMKSPWSSTATYTAASIAAPTGLTLTQTTQTDANGVAVPALLASWTASTSAAVARYEVSGKLSTDATWYGQGTTGETKFVYSPIVGGLTYEARVRSVATNGLVSAWTSTATYSVPGVTAPTGVTVAATTATAGDGTVLPAIAVTWTASTDARVTAYEVQGKLSTDANYASFVVTGATTRYVHTPLIPGVTYNVRVRAIAGDGTFSAWASAADFSASAIAPPTALSVSEVADTAADGTKVNRLVATWTASTSADVTAYEVQGKFSTDASYVSFTVAGGTTTRYVHPDVVPGVTYNVRVRAISSTGAGSAWTAVVNYASGSIQPPTNLAVTQTTDIAPDGTTIPRLLATWTASTSSDVAAYEVQGKLSTDASYSSFVTAGNTTQYVHPVVIAGATYNVRVRALSSSGVGSAFTAVVTYAATGDTTAPGAPSALTATGGLRSVRLTWTNPTDKDYAYTEVWEHTSDARASATKVGQVSGTNWVRSDLDTGATRYYWIRAVDFSGNIGAWNATTGVSATASAVATADISAGAVTAAAFASTIRPVEIVSALPSTGNFAGRIVFLTTDNKLYRYDGSAWTAAVPAVDVTGTLTNAQIADLAAAKLTGQITTTQITDSAISTAKIAAGAVTTATLAASAVTAGTIAANAVTAAKIDAGAVTTAKLAAGAVTADTIAANAIVAGKIAAAAISATEIAVNSISVNRLTSSASTFNGVSFALGASQLIRGYYAGGNFVSSSASTYGLIVANSGGFDGLGAATTNTDGGASGVVGVGAANSVFTQFQTIGRLGAGNAGGFFAHSGSGTFPTASANRWIELANNTYAYQTGGGAAGTFTGAHDTLIPRTSPLPEPGDILVDVQVVRAANMYDVVCENAVSQSPSQAGVVGVFIEESSSTHVPPALVETVSADGPVPVANIDELREQYRFCVANAVGEGQINVCGEGGDIAIGDLIVTSSLPGKGMRQSDNLVRSITVAKAREAVTFAGPTDVKTIACIYLCG